MNIAKHLEHNYTLTQSCREIGTFNETSEPHILLDRCVGQKARSTLLLEEDLIKLTYKGLKSIPEQSAPLTNIRWHKKDMNTIN